VHTIFFFKGLPFTAISDMNGIDEIAGEIGLPMDGFLKFF
jgi:hypothetical protein